jgi:hypothetical protein
VKGAEYFLKPLYIPAGVYSFYSDRSPWFPPSHLQDPGGSVGQDLDRQHPGSRPHLLVDELLLGPRSHQARVRAQHHHCSVIQTPDTALRLVAEVGGGVWS